MAITRLRSLGFFLVIGFVAGLSSLKPAFSQQVIVVRGNRDAVPVRRPPVVIYPGQRGPNDRGGDPRRDDRRPDPRTERRYRPVPVHPGSGRPGDVMPGPVTVTRGYGRRGRIVVVATRNGDAADVLAADMVARHSTGLDCEDLGELLRRVSNEALGAADAGSDRLDPRDPQDAQLRNRAIHVRRFLANPQFRAKIMERLVTAFQGCNRTCFDDGEAIGVLSGTMFCEAAVELGGLPDAGFQFQNRIPVCETGNFVGCQQGYTQAVNSVQGCLNFASGVYAAPYNHQVSQDCHID